MTDRQGERADARVGVGWQREVRERALLEYADRIYDVLVAICGATDDNSGRVQFRVFCARPGSVEFRFVGALGFGGKFWDNAGRWYVSCYREDETDARLEMIARADALLGVLHDAAMADV